MHTKPALGALAILATLALAPVSKAQLQLHVKVATSSLMGNPAGPYSLDFQFNDGSGWGDGNNHATLTNFKFGGGSVLGSSTTYGSAGGSLASSVWMNDTDSFYNEFYQGFTAGSWLSFDLSVTTNTDDGGTPDLFTLAILDGALMNIPTQSLASDTLLEINLNRAWPMVATFASADGSITASAVPVPEASTYGVCGMAVLVLLAFMRRFRRQESGNSIR